MIEDLPDLLNQQEVVFDYQETHSLMNFLEEMFIHEKIHNPAEKFSFVFFLFAFLHFLFLCTKTLLIL